MAYLNSECQHEENDDCMYCKACGSGCREDLDCYDMCPDCSTEPLEEILNSYINGQRKQMTTQILEYGVDFWVDIRDHFTSLEYPLSRQLDLYQGITISYNYNYPHIN